MSDSPNPEIHWLIDWLSKRQKTAPLPQNIAETNYIESGLVDSVSMIHLIEDIEAHFGFRFAARHFADPRWPFIGGLATIIAELHRSGAR